MAFGRQSTAAGHIGIGALLLIGCLGGCAAGPALHTARTLNAGETELGAGVTLGRNSYESLAYYDGSGPTTRPGRKGAWIVPELRGWYGWTGSLDTGARIVFGQGWLPLCEINTQWQFFQRGRFHAAIAPALGGRPGTSAPSLGHALLPVLATFDITRQVGVTAGFHVGKRWSGQTAEDPHDLAFDDTSLRGMTGTTYGASLNADWHDETRRILAGVQWQRLTGRVGAEGNLDFPIDVLQVGVTVGWLPFKHAQNLDKTDDDLDRLTRPH